MILVGKVESLWRYPVKSMRGEELNEAFAGYPGVYGDRVFAFKSSASPTGFPYFTAREQRRLLQYRPLFRFPDKAARPVNFTEADIMGAGPLSADISELLVDIETPAGKTLAIDDPVLIEMLRSESDEKHQLTLMRSHRAMTDCRPMSIFSVQSARQLSEEFGGTLIAPAIPDDRRTRTWGICTGAGADSSTLREAAERQLDTLIVGEGPHHTAVEARELGIVVLYAGHYATETLGVRALGDLLAERFAVSSAFIDVPTGL